MLSDFEVKASQFMENDKGEILARFTIGRSAHIYFDNYSTVGTELKLIQGNIEVARIKMSDKGLKRFKSEFSKFVYEDR